MSTTITATKTSSITTVIDRFKPHKAEALQRIRVNGLCLVTVLVLSYLLPLPSLFHAMRTLFRPSDFARWSSDWWYEWVCIIEMGLITVLSYNILEGVYAIKYPRAPLPAIMSPAKAKSPVKTTTKTPSRPFKILSPNTSPQPQKPFAFSPSASLTSASIALASSGYKQSPVSTPSRVIQYKMPLSSSTTTQGSSVSDYLASPSPVISAYRGKHSSNDVGRALDGSYLARLAPEVEDLADE
ncbi:hypothetical protein CVT24_007159 [Panaeolus cyanescens]|uniref:Uncharacterized protein n=1 Tax=Panaeolus cyanescens TaxID=181874 RepID=A0A409YPJ2_9AGAR|nr:hypothetical protein CVT24_007159 [Panaeolus cyanescens]